MGNRQVLVREAFQSLGKALLSTEELRTAREEARYLQRHDIGRQFWDRARILRVKSMEPGWTGESGHGEEQKRERSKGKGRWEDGRTFLPSGA